MLTACAKGAVPLSSDEGASFDRGGPLLHPHPRSFAHAILAQSITQAIYRIEGAGSEMESSGLARNLARTRRFGGRSGRFPGAGLKSEQCEGLLGVSGPLLRRRRNNKSAQMNRG